MYFFPATSTAAQDGDDADVFGNPVRRLVGPNASWWMEELACCLCGCLATGPMFIIIGMVFLLTAASDPRREGIRQYNRDVSSWTQATSGGMAQLDSLYPQDMSVLMATLQTDGPDPVPYSSVVSLAPQTTVTPLADNGTSISSYATTLWFEGPLPAWSVWPSADQYATLRPVGADGAFFDAITLQLVQCSNSRAEAYGSNCTTSGPGAGTAAGPSVAPATNGTVSGGGQQGGGGGGAAATRRLSQFGQVSCVQFLREVRVPSELALELIPPRGCVSAGSARCGGNWTLRSFPEGCGTTFVTVQAEVSEQTWVDDLRSGSPPAWCANWSTTLPKRVLPPPTVLSVRSQYDPYSQAAAITGCSFNFGPTTTQYAAFALNLIFFGVSVVTITGCCLVALVARAASEAAARGEGASFARDTGGGYGGGYGSTGWYGAGGRSFY